MTVAPIASVIINNYNYGRFLPEAIDSALSQTYSNVEVIVVDDGSTDDSREAISIYGDRVVPVLKENAGQTSTFNLGFLSCRGDVVCYLDADDVLLSTAIEYAMERFVAADIVKVHWPLWVVDGRGKRTGRMKPGGGVPEGDLRAIIVRDGPDSAAWAPTSGNAWSRSFLARILPIPETERECGVGSASADAYLSMLAPLFGRVARVAEPQSLYRVHGRNDHSSMEFEKRLTRDLHLFRHRSAVLARYCREVRLDVDPEVWERNSWFFRLSRAISELDATLPYGEPFVLVDSNHWMTPDRVAGRRRIPFLERDGQYWGAPSNDTVAIQELDRLRGAGVRSVAVAWTAFWWLEYYAEFHRHLRSHYHCALETERVIVFEADGRV